MNKRLNITSCSIMDIFRVAYTIVTFGCRNFVYTQGRLGHETLGVEVHDTDLNLSLVCNHFETNVMPDIIISSTPSEGMELPRFSGSG